MHTFSSFLSNYFLKLSVLLLMLVSGVIYNIHAMDMPSSPFFQAVSKGNGGWDIEVLNSCLKSRKCLNTPCPRKGVYPLAEIIRFRKNSSYITTGMLSGADVLCGDTTFKWTLYHQVAQSYRMFWQEQPDYIPKQNLLSLLALTEHQEIEVDEKIAKERIITALLCLNRLHAGLKQSPIKYCILSHLDDDIYCHGLFSRVIEQRLHPERLVENYPLDWLLVISLRARGDERRKFAQKFAPLVVRHRLQAAQEVLKLRDYRKKTAYDISKDQIETFTKRPDATQQLLDEINQMERDLNPQGFVKRHVKDCTKIIANVIKGQEPFHGFSIVESSAAFKEPTEIKES